MKRALLGLTLLSLAAFSTLASIPFDIPALARIGVKPTYRLEIVTPAPLRPFATGFALMPTSTPTPRPTPRPMPRPTPRPTRTPRPSATPEPTPTFPSMGSLYADASGAAPSALDIKLAMLIDGGLVVEVFDGGLLDLDNDGALDGIRFTWDTDGFGTGSYTLSANASSFSGECESLLYRLYAGRLSGPAGPIFLMVADNGPSDDPLCHLYEYSGGVLRSVGTVPALPESFVIGGRGFSTEVRGRVLHTWFRPAEYEILPPVAEVPRDVYPMNDVVTMRIDLDLLGERGGDAVSATLRSGEEAMLASTDDVEWVYIIRRGDKTVGGWMHLVDGLYCEVDGALLEPQYVFDGLVMAD